MGKLRIFAPIFPAESIGLQQVFLHSKEGAGKNYTERSNKSVLVDISDKKEQSIRIVPVEGKKFGDGSFELRVEGGARCWSCCVFLQYR